MTLADRWWWQSQKQKRQKLIEYLWIFAVLLTSHDELTQRKDKQRNDERERDKLTWEKSWKIIKNYNNYLSRLKIFILIVNISSKKKMCENEYRKSGWNSDFNNNNILIKYNLCCFTSSSLSVDDWIIIVQKKNASWNRWWNWKYEDIGIVVVVWFDRNKNYWHDVDRCRRRHKMIYWILLGRK